MTPMPHDLPKAYDPTAIEDHWAEYWVKEQLFRADVNAPGPVFSIVIPPPNVTGSLHIGHMLDHTEIDILTRWHRMRGYNALYLPGTDHAGISTQRVVVRQLAEQGINYRDLGREEFVRRVWKWKEESGSTITNQMRRIGAAGEHRSRNVSCVGHPFGPHAEQASPAENTNHQLYRRRR